MRSEKRELAYELMQPYEMTNFKDELSSLQERIYLTEIQSVIISLEQVQLLIVDEALLLVKAVDALRVMGRSVRLTKIQPSIALVLNECSDCFQISDS